MTAVPGPDVESPGSQGTTADPSDQPVYRPRRVVHLVGHATPEVLSFLAPATLALARDGVRQHILVMQLDAGARRVSQWGLATQAVVEVLAPEPRRMLRWHRLAQALNRALASDRRAVLHLHGYLPALLGSVALMVARRRTPTVYTPHGSRALQSALPFGALLRAVGRTSAASITNHAFESNRLAGQTRTPVHMAECPLPPALLRVDRVEGDRARVVAGALEQSAHGARDVARMAVLLGGDGLDVQFEWTGALDDAARALLRAVRIPNFGDPAAAEPAMQTAADAGAPADGVQTDDGLSRLASAWVHLAPAPVSHFPVLLAQAMALGVPCVALDVPCHRALIRHGETGYLCQNPDDLLHWTAALLQSPALRAQIGAAAREHARSRSDEAQFHRALTAAYAAAVPGTGKRMGVVAQRPGWVADAGVLR